LGRNPIADLSKVYILINDMQFPAGTEYFISPLPRFLHRERDTSWFLSVDSMTALECIRRGLGPHTIDIANFLINHGVRFRTFQLIQNSPNSEIPPVRPQCRYLGYRSLNYSFDLADFAGYEVLRDSFLRSQPHGPLALREGGIIARLAREVLPNSNALSGPSSEALGGHRACLVCDDKIYVEDEFSDDELRLICGSYALLADTGMKIFFNLICKLVLTLLSHWQSHQRMSRGFRPKTYGKGLGTMLASGRKSVKDGSRVMSQKFTLVASSLFLPEIGVLQFATPGQPKN